MKLNKVLVALSLMVTGTNLAAAAETATLRVTGKLLPGSCSVNLSDGGIADYGTMLTGSLSATQDNQLPERKLNMTIRCSSSQRVAYSFNDERNNSLHPGVIENASMNGDKTEARANQFGLGFANDGTTKLGRYSISSEYNMMSYVGPGGTGDMLYITKNGSGNWTDKSNGDDLAHNGVDSDRKLMTIGSPFSITPVPFNELNMPLKISGVLRSGNELNITDETMLDGEATISLVYL